MEEVKGLGSDEKKFRINGKLLSINEIKFSFPDIYHFILSYHSDSPALEVHTSGSTGSPKPILLSKKYMRVSAEKTAEALGLQAKYKCLLCLPVNRIGGVMMLVRWLQSDLDLYPQGNTATPLAETHTSFEFGAMVPYQVQQSLKDLSLIKKLIIGGGPVNPDLEQKLKDMPNAIFHTYGMTETISHVALRRINGATADGAFHALPGVRFDIDERNCLIIHAPDIGVSNLVTNDVVELHSTSSFTWKGRFDNVVNSGGIKLFPEEIEKKLGDIGYHYFLFGQKDERLGERLVMLVENEAEVTVDQFADNFSSLPKYERPKAVFTVPAFKTSAGGKLDRKGSINSIKTAGPSKL